MTTVFFIALVVMFVSSILISLRAKKRGKGISVFLAKPLLSEAEQVVYWRLIEAFSGEKIVLAQVAFSSFIDAQGGSKSENFTKFALARHKVADFVICNKDFSIYAIVEIVGSTYTVIRDAGKDLIAEEAGLKTYSFNVESLPSATEIKEKII